MKSNRFETWRRGGLFSIWIKTVLLFAAGVYCNNLVAESTYGILTLPDAERVAVNNDPLIAEVKAKQESLREKSVAADSWPDPMLKLGLMSLSMETYEFEDEAMTQNVIGITQRIPAWGSLDAKSGQLFEMAEAVNHEVKNRELKTLLAVRKDWLEVYYQYQAEALVKKSAEIFDQLKEITRLQYRSGRGSQRDVITAQLEKSLLEDKLTATHTMWQTAVAKLHKWLGRERIIEDVDTSFPELAIPSTNQELRESLEEHPWLKAAKARIKAAEKGVDYAYAQTRPGVSLDLQYGQRGAERADLGSAMIMVDLPLFTGNRQDRQIKASQADLSATQRKMDELRRQLNERLEVQWAIYDQADARLMLYEKQVLPEAKQNTEATLSAYQSGVTEFSSLVRARLTELNSELQYLKLKVNKAKAQVELLYLGGS